jgi:hypothetical protein
LAIGNSFFLSRLTKFQPEVSHFDRQPLSLFFSRLIVKFQEDNYSKSSDIVRMCYPKYSLSTPNNYTSDTLPLKICFVKITIVLNQTKLNKNLDGGAQLEGTTELRP